LHRSRILNRPFRNLQPVALTIGPCLCFGCVYQVYRQDEARAISAFALPIDIAPHNPIGLATGVSPAAAESSNRLRDAGQGYPDPDAIRDPRNPPCHAGALAKAGGLSSLRPPKKVLSFLI